MKIALIGYGKMGKTIERIALERGHEIVSVIDVDNLDGAIVANISKGKINNEVVKIAY